ncbi:tetratricopeptide repeat-containing sulfotransferase family protein [Caulobacter mirabilis]|uniref:tetratricopeptide repeat-containing sulfotransferase family protein n=1 Tax=Caulobacter mirabilis TaxID=69666 RepID=UPI001559C932|nr:sulfotransferase [Caulobacter mirabilis]
MIAPHPLVLEARSALQAGDARRASAAAAKRLQAAPADVDALEIRFLVARQIGTPAEAETILRLILDQAPELAWAHHDLAQLLAGDGRRHDALAAAETAARLDPGNPQTHLTLGALLSEAGGLAPGEHHLRQALVHAGEHPAILAPLALNLLTQGQLDEAEPLYEKLERLGALDVPALAHWAKLREARGDLDGAHRLLDRAEAGGGDVRLGRAVVLARGGRAAEAVALLDAPGPRSLSADAQLERGRLRDRLGRHDEAWADYVSAKARLSQETGRRYEAGAVGDRLSRLQRAFAHPAMPVSTVREERPLPVFILGFPRSGTTLVEQVLSSHSQVRAGGELPFLAELEDVDLGDLTTAAVHLRDHYLTRAEAYGLRRPGARWFTDKMPLNDIWLPLLRLAFPDSPIIRVRRHPLDVAVSMLSHHLTHGFDCGYRIEDIFAHMRAMQTLSEAYDAAAGAPFTLRYEAFVADQEALTRQMLALLDLPLEPACLTFHESRRYAPTPSYAQVTEPLNDRSVGRWRRHADRLAPFLPALAELLEAQGYAG